MTIIGIDPGLDGAFAFLRPETYECHAMPTIANPNGKGRQYDVDRIVALCDHRESPRAYLERQQAYPKQGGVSNFTIGRGYGLWLGILAALYIPVTEVHPRTWQTIMLAGIAKGDTKAASIFRCKQLFPGVVLRRSEKCTKDHDGLAGALLIAEFGRRIEIGD